MITPCLALLPKDWSCPDRLLKQINVGIGPCEFSPLAGDPLQSLRHDSRLTRYPTVFP